MDAWVTDSISYTLGMFLEKIVLIAGKKIIKCFNARDTLRELASKVELIQAFLSETRRWDEGTSAAIARWVKRNEAVPFEGMNLLDEFEYFVLTGKQQFAFNFVSDMYINIRILSNISEINSKLDVVYRESCDVSLKLVTDSKTGSELKQNRQTDYSVVESEVVGRENDVRVVVEMLLYSNSAENMPVISVVGMAGVGKTTLAQLVYNDPQVANHFTFRMWVSIDTDFNVDRILKEMLENLTLKKVDVSSRGAILQMLRNKLQGKRYLLVLDDVWNESQEVWDSMSKCLHEMGGSKGSRILVTTRNVKVTSAMRSSLIHHLQLLPISESWSLFQRIAFGGGSRTQTLDGNIERILRKCGGLPLAIKVLGGLFYSTTDKIKLLNSENIGILFDSPFQTPNVLFTCLKMSYDSLPSLSVQQCFVYCSIFPKHSVLEKEKLVQLWMAQGFITQPPEQCQEMEDLGDECFNLLLQRSMLLEVQKDVSNNIKSCKMHDLVHDFASALSENYCVIREIGEADADIFSSVVHLYLIFRGSNTAMPRSDLLPMLRTLCLDEGILPRRLTSIKYVRVLILNNLKARKLSTSIKYLIHLRYLDVSRTRIERLPNCIRKLYFLQTLRLYALVEMPKSFGKLINLRHLHVENVLHNNRNCLLPGVGELVQLRTIPHFVVSQEKGCQIRELGQLHFLRGELKIFGLENVKDCEEAKAANLSSKSQIRTLELHWDSMENRKGGSEDEDILQGLLPNSNLQCLTISNFGGSKFPSWIAQTSHSFNLLSNLVTIKLQNCNMCEQIPALGHLPSLIVVQINNMKYVTHITEDFYGIQNTKMFPVLKELTITGMSRLVEWSDAPSTSVAVFPSLENLTVKGCPQLTSLPDAISFIPLRGLSIINCGKLNRLPEGLRSLISLEFLEILNCNYLKNIPSIASLKALRKLSIVDCKNLRALPSGLEVCKSLIDLYILSCPLPQIVGDLHHSTSLRKLEMGCFSDDLHYFPWPCSISSITNAADSISYDIQSYSQPHFISLTSLKLYGWPKLVSLPEQVQHIPQLKHLQVCLFDGLETLPEWLGKIQSLTTLDLEDCWNLASLPSVKLTNLNRMKILRCPILEHRCTRTTGAEWHKIDHIPQIYLGHQEGTS